MSHLLSPEILSTTNGKRVWILPTGKCSGNFQSIIRDERVSGLEMNQKKHNNWLIDLRFFAGKSCVLVWAL